MGTALRRPLDDEALAEGGRPRTCAVAGAPFERRAGRFAPRRELDL